MGRAKKNYTKGVYHLEYVGKGHWDLTHVTSLTGDPTGMDNMNVSITLEQGITCQDLKEAVKKHKITRAIWYGRDEYVTPKEINSGRWMGIIVI